jgi:hypothetical protein
MPLFRLSRGVARAASPARFELERGGLSHLRPFSGLLARVLVQVCARAGPAVLEAPKRLGNPAPSG